MNKFLSIIIPYHNENEDLFRPLLSSLNSQLGIDFNQIEIIITNNFTHEEIKDLNNIFIDYKNIYPFIQYEECPYKSSMGPNREFGMSLATGKYLMFCDFDDIIYSPLSLFLIFEYIKHNDFDLYDFYSIKELDQRNLNGEAIFELNKTNPVLLHGKVYNHQFIKDKNIHFCHKLFAWEDMYFNQIIEQNNPRRTEIPIPVYMWKFRASSVSKALGAEEIYQQKHWRDGILKNYYILDYIKYYNILPQEDFNELLFDTVLSWYNNNTDILMNPEEVPVLWGYIIKSFDPDLKILLKLGQSYSNIFNKNETFKDFIERITKDIDLNQINIKYNIGHFNDLE